MGNQVEPFEPMHFYHLYSHAVGAEQLFRTEENYHYFMQRYAAYVPPVAATYAFCLMPNHYHLLLQTPRANLSAAAVWLQTTYRIRFNRRHRRSRWRIALEQGS